MHFPRRFQNLCCGSPHLATAQVWCRGSTAAPPHFQAERGRYPGHMGQVLEAIDGRLRDFIEAQHLYFVGTAPNSAEGHINLSPKGTATPSQSSMKRPSPISISPAVEQSLSLICARMVGSSSCSALSTDHPTSCDCTDEVRSSLPSDSRWDDSHPLPRPPRSQGHRYCPCQSDQFLVRAGSAALRVCERSRPLLPLGRTQVRGRPRRVPPHSAMPRASMASPPFLTRPVPAVELCRADAKTVST